MPGRIRRHMNRAAAVGGGAALVVLTVWAFSGTPSFTGPVNQRVGASEAYNPATAGEVLPDGFRQLLPRDAIAPVYDPVFVTAAGVDWPGTTEVIGVEGGGEVKAYPVSFLNRREMVVDEIGGDPILVTW